jgi:hypothetical protein
MFLHRTNDLTFRHSNFKRNEEHITFETILNEIKNTFVDCKINTGTEYKVDDTFRKGQQDWSYNYCANFDLDFVNNIHRSYPKWVICPSRFLLLKYDIGGFFKKHCDHCQGIRESNGKKFKHVATILIIPPMFLHEHTGGELNLFLDNKTETISATNEWTIIIFKLGIVHEVLPLTSGIRYVFKGEIYERVE